MKTEPVLKERDIKDGYVLTGEQRQPGIGERFVSILTGNVLACTPYDARIGPRWIVTKKHRCVPEGYRLVPERRQRVPMMDIVLLVDGTTMRIYKQYSTDKWRKERRNAVIE